MDEGLNFEFGGEALTTYDGDTLWVLYRAVA
jgi:hypothetical protein